MVNTNYSIDNNTTYKMNLLKSRLLGYKTLEEFALEHNYCSAAINLMSGKDLTNETKNILKIAMSNPRMSHLKDTRNIAEHFIFVILGWILEDYIIDNSFGIYIKNGSDKNRDLINHTVTNKPDLLNTLTGVETEVCSEYYQRKGDNFNKTIFLRDQKYLNLKKEKTNLLTVNLFDHTYLLRDINKFSAQYASYNPKFGGKAGYHLSIPDIGNHFLPANKFYAYLHNKSQEKILC